MMLEALTINNGVVTDACNQCGIPRRTHYNWMDSDDAYRKMLLQATKNTMSLRDWIPLQRKNTNGYVYLIHCKETTFYKIGISKNYYGARLQVLQTGCPFELEMIYVIHSNDHCNLEKELHDKFEDKRVRGEWFDLDEASLDTAIKYLEDTHQPQMQIDFQGKDDK